MCTSYMQSTFETLPHLLHDPLLTYSTQVAHSAQLLSFASVMFNGHGTHPSSADQKQGSRRGAASVASSTVARNPYYTVESEPQFAAQQGMPEYDAEKDDTSPFAYQPPSTAGGAPPSSHHAVKHEAAPTTYHSTTTPYTYQYSPYPQHIAAGQPTSDNGPSSATASHHTPHPYHYASQPSYPPPGYSRAPRPPSQSQYQGQEMIYPSESYHEQLHGQSPTQSPHAVGFGSATGFSFPLQAQGQFQQYAPSASASTQQSTRLLTVGAPALAAPYETRLFPDISTRSLPSHPQDQAYASAVYNMQFAAHQELPFVFAAGQQPESQQADPSNPPPGRRPKRDLPFEEDNKYHCLQCSFTSARSHDLRRHMKKHGKNRTRPCSQCGRDFARSDALTRHQKGTKNCPRAKRAGDQGDGGPSGKSSDKEGLSADDEEEDEGEDDGSRQGGSNDGSALQRPGSGWSTRGDEAMRKRR